MVVSPRHVRATAVACDFQFGSPPALKTRHYPRVSNAGRTSRWRQPSVRRGVAFVALGLIAFLLAGFMLRPASDRQDSLERDGVEVPGVVTKARDPIRGPRSVEFRYAFDGMDFEGEIFGSNSYEPGDSVTVFVDPTEPSRATLPDEQPQSGPAYVLTLIVVTGSFLLLAAGVVDLWKRWRRTRP